jgi:tetratricopeptide (TPR) repeat protein
MLRHNSILTMAITSSIVSSIFISGCWTKAFAQFYNDNPDSEENWMIDHTTRKILTRDEYLEKLRKLRLKLEQQLQTAIKAGKQEDLAESARQLFQIYFALGLYQEANSLAEKIEPQCSENLCYGLEEVYRRCNNRPRLVKILSESYTRAKPARSAQATTAEYDQLADLYYQIGDMDKAEENYKKATDIALQGIIEPIRESGTRGLVCTGALNSYACFLADRGRFEEAAMLMNKAMDFSENPSYDTSVGYAGPDDYGTFVKILKERHSNQYEHFYHRWQSINSKTAFAGILGKSGTELTEPIFASLSNFSEGSAAAGDRLTRRVGYINKYGFWRIEPKFIEANPFSKGVATAKISEGILPIDVAGQFTNFTVIDTKGKELRQLPDKAVKPFADGICIGKRSQHRLYNGIRDIIDDNGDILFSACISEPIEKTNHELSLFIFTGMLRRGCIMDSLGYEIKVAIMPDPARPGHSKLQQLNAQAQASEAQSSSQSYESWSALWRERAHGEITIAPVHMERANSYRYLVDRDGNRLTPGCTRIEKISSRLFQFFIPSGKCGLITEGGKIIVQADYDAIRPFSEGLAACKRDGVWGFVDSEGKEVIPPKYIEVGDFHDGVTFYRRLAKLPAQSTQAHR